MTVFRLKHFSQETWIRLWVMYWRTTYQVIRYVINSAEMFSSYGANVMLFANNRFGFVPFLHEWSAVLYSSTLPYFIEVSIGSPVQFAKTYSVAYPRAQILNITIQVKVKDGTKYGSLLSGKYTKQRQGRSASTDLGSSQFWRRDNVVLGRVEIAT